MAESLPSSSITVGPSRAFHVLVWFGLPVLGAGVGWLLAWGLDWVLGLSWAPFQGPLRLLDDVTGSWTLPVLVGLGVVLGVVVALSAYDDVAYVTVGPDGVTVTQGDVAQEVPRALVAAVFPEGKQLVVQDRSGRRRARGPIGDVPVDRLRAAFVAHGYGWVEADPFEGSFSRWVEDAPGLPVGADAFLAARQRALEHGDAKDVESLRVELDRLGVVVREDGTRQFWRAVR